ncbi:MAG: peptidase M2 family protein [Alphaproteobacteria bacterium]|nr:MAG: peptidase M2 family protein [Alphaproteobacteria bacterium]
MQRWVTRGSRLALVVGAGLLLAACADATKKQPSVEEAKAFLADAESRLAAIEEEASRIGWVNATFITYDTDWLNSKMTERYTKLLVDLAHEAARYKDLDLPEEMARKIKLLRLSLVLPAPRGDDAATSELARITTELQSAYATGKYCPGKETQLKEFARPDGCLSLTELEQVMAKSRDPDQLEEAWTGWRTISVPMKPKYARMVEIANAGARDLGFADVGAMWRSNYDMPPEEFTREVDRLWSQVKPMYGALHCYVRAKLNEKYGDAVVPLDQPIRADLLGNMWAQAWGNIYDIVQPEGAAPAYDLTALLHEKGYKPLDMVHTADRFFQSLGFAPLPETFWKRSMFAKPVDHEAVCHASAWDLDGKDDIRIKMCIKVDAEDFQTIHHEIGHNIYQRAYKNQPPLFRNGANDGFHEAIGDMIALSITPEYLQKIGLLEELPPADADLGLLMAQALEKVAFLPFGLLVDKWRWEVFSGKVDPAHYNDAWWRLRTLYQGIRPPADRPADAFDPGAKYHIPGNTPYMRYFLAHIYQFQFHRAACRQAGWKGPLHRCSIYGEEEVGKRFARMLEMGASKPWPEALAAFTGETRADASAIQAYFQPLKDWLDKQNEGRQCGWQ